MFTFAGIRTSAVVIPAANTLNLVAVHFRPGGGFAFFDLPAGELQDRIVPLDVLWGSSLRFLRDKLLETGSARQKCRIVEQYLLSRLNAGRVIHPAVRYALRELQENHSQPSIAAIRDKTGYGAKRFIQLFRDEVGTTPKLLQRIIRFNGILRLLDGRADLDWTEVAHASGYFDQSHFNHDFRQFCGFCPGTYVRNRVTQTHVRIPN